MMKTFEQAQIIYETQVGIAQAIEKETGYKMPPSTIGRIIKGEAKPATASLVEYALNNAISKLRQPVSVFESDEQFPVYLKYEQEFNPQPAYLTLDIRNGEVDADYNGNIGGGCSPDEFHGLVRRYYIPAMTTNHQIENLIESLEPHFIRVLMMTEEVWDGNNYVCGPADGFDNEDISTIDNAIEEAIHKELDYDDPAYICDDFAEYLGDSWSLNASQSFDEQCQDMLTLNGDNGCYLPLHIKTLDDIKDAWLDVLVEYLEAGEDLNQLEANLLLEDGRCENGNYMDELREFAAQLA